MSKTPETKATTQAELLQALHDAGIENSGQAALLERTREEADHYRQVIMDQIRQIEDLKNMRFAATTRFEPSRLEIAAMIAAGTEANQDYTWQNEVEEARYCLKVADALIAESRRIPE
jgi:hypothetical protein